MQCTRLMPLTIITSAIRLKALTKHDQKLCVCFNVTCVTFCLQIFLISDVIHAYLLYCYDLKHGWPRVDRDGNQVKLKLS